MTQSRSWEVITGEYPPTGGGVADHTHQLATKLAECGDDVRVWAPLVRPAAHTRGVEVRCVPRFGPQSLLQVGAELHRNPRSTVLVQYAPHSFGFRGMNIGLCALLKRVPRERVWIYFHEVRAPWLEGRLDQRAVGVVQSSMAWLALSAASRVFVSIKGWEPVLWQLGAGTRSLEWMPVPSNIPVISESGGSRKLGLPPGVGWKGIVVGHFGTYGSAVTRLLEPTLCALANSTFETRLLLLGRGSSSYLRQLEVRCPAVAGRVYALGASEAADVSAALSTCDVVVQPFPDGVSARRGTVMAALAHAVPVVTNLGFLSEPIWKDSGAVVGVDEVRDLPDATMRLLMNEAERQRLSRRGRELYQDRFSWENTLRLLRSPASRDQWNV